MFPSHDRGEETGEDDRLAPRVVREWRFVGRGVKPPDSLCVVVPGFYDREFLEQHDLETPLCYSRPHCAIADAPSQVSDQ